MTTINQLMRKPRRAARRQTKTSRTLKRCPFKRGIVLKTMVIKPIKPNSADRKCCRVVLSNDVKLTAHIPGEGHNIQEHANVLIRGGNVPDLPGVKHKVVRGVFDCAPIEVSPKFGTRRNRGRSRYGTKKYGK